MYGQSFMYNENYKYSVVHVELQHAVMVHSRTCKMTCVHVDNYNLRSAQEFQVFISIKTAIDWFYAT